MGPGETRWDRALSTPSELRRYIKPKTRIPVEDKGRASTHCSQEALGHDFPGVLSPLLAAKVDATRRESCRQLWVFAAYCGLLNIGTLAVTTVEGSSRSLM